MFSEKCDQIAEDIVKRGLAVPAIFLLEAHKPLTRLVHAGVALSMPVGTVLFGNNFGKGAIELFESPENVEMLICSIEQRVKQKRQPQSP